jgi:glycine/D-amino acid oxidase-like deaminating enzyme
MGASTAFWLKRSDPQLRVALIDRDYSFSQASSSLSASSIRQQFTAPVNIALSQFGIDFLRHVSAYLSCDGEAVDLGLTEPGYLYLASTRQARQLHKAWSIQMRHGAQVELLSAPDLRMRFPWINTDGIELGALGIDGEGWFDGPALHQAFLKKALKLGVIKIQAEVVGLQRETSLSPPEQGHRRSKQKIRSIILNDGRQIHSDIYICAAGAWSGQLLKTADIELPIVPVRRTVFVLSCPVQLPDCPLIIDSSGFWLRPEGKFFIAGMPPQPAAQTSEHEPLVPDYRELDEARWALLAHRIPAFEAMRIESAWAGYYEMNLFDHNAVIGPLHNYERLYCIAGFSGHGMQHAPGAGLALSEWILQGKPDSVDVSPLHHERLAENKPLWELNIIG